MMYPQAGRWAYLLELQPGTYSVTGSVSGHAGFTTGAARGIVGVWTTTGFHTSVLGRH